MPIPIQYRFHDQLHQFSSVCVTRIVCMYIQQGWRSVSVWRIDLSPASIYLLLSKSIYLPTFLYWFSSLKEPIADWEAALISWLGKKGGSAASAMWISHSIPPADRWQRNKGGGEESMGRKHDDECLMMTDSLPLFFGRSGAEGKAGNHQSITLRPTANEPWMSHDVSRAFGAQAFPWIFLQELCR